METQFTDYLAQELQQFSASDMEHGAKILRKAHNLLARGPHKWTKGEFARGKNQVYVYNVSDRRAFCFCALGAIDRVGGDSGRGPEATALQLALNLKNGQRDIAAVNDDKSTAYETIVNAFDFASRFLKDEAKAAAKREKGGLKAEKNYQRTTATW